MAKKSRRKARELVVQALYQRHMTDDSVLDLQLQFQEQDMQHVDEKYFSDCLQGVVKHLDDLNTIIVPVLDREMDELNPVELAILHLATYELKLRQDVPFKVAINEALELAKIFGAVEGYKYVNGVLDKIAHKIRK